MNRGGPESMLELLRGQIDLGWGPRAFGRSKALFREDFERIYSSNLYIHFTFHSTKSLQKQEGPEMASCFLKLIHREVKKFSAFIIVCAIYLYVCMLCMFVHTV